MDTDKETDRRLHCKMIIDQTHCMQDRLIQTGTSTTHAGTRNTNCYASTRAVIPNRLLGLLEDFSRPN